MTDYILIFLVSFTIAFSGALMPGPLLTAVISQSVKHGFKSGAVDLRRPCPDGSVDDRVDHLRTGQLYT